MARPPRNQLADQAQLWRAVNRRRIRPFRRWYIVDAGGYCGRHLRWPTADERAVGFCGACFEPGPPWLYCYEHRRWLTPPEPRARAE